MWKAILLVTGFLLSTTTAFAGSIYKCNTQEGVVFSQTPCAPNAVKLKSRKSQGSQQSVNGQAVNGQEGPTDGSIDIRIFEALGAVTAEIIVERVGHPAAKYTHDGTEHWLYPNAIRESNNARQCPELLLEDGRKFQTTWLPEDVMINSVEVAKGLSNWKQPSSIRKKAFSVGDTVVMGKNKSKVISKLGQPDAKRVFNGREIWEYKEVQLAKNNPDTLTIFLTFEGDIVASSAGN